MTDDSIMPFGKHRGKKLANVPAAYLLWLNEQMEENPPDTQQRIELKRYIEANMEVLRMERNRKQ